MATFHLVCQGCSADHVTQSLLYECPHCGGRMELLSAKRDAIAQPVAARPVGDVLADEIEEYLRTLQ